MMRLTALLVTMVQPTASVFREEPCSTCISHVAPPRDQGQRRERLGVCHAAAARTQAAAMPVLIPMVKVLVVIQEPHAIAR
jgi:hypothetical protein